jgi:L-threonylcarbamoyladenylate synthase
VSASYVSVSLRKAARIVNAGGVIAYPTEAVFGLGCDPANKNAVHRILTIKRRAMKKGLILIAADFAQLEPWLQPLSSADYDTLQSSWPGPVTWLLPARPDTPYWLRGDHTTLAVRVTNHPLARALCRTAGMALVSTSANISTRAPARHVWQVHRHLGHMIDFVVAGRVGDNPRPTEIRELSSGRIVRAG